MAEMAGIVLAGGRSSRMGADKASLPWKGKRLIDHVAEALRGAGIDHIYTSGNIDGYDAIPDAFPGYYGPVMGICSSLRRLRRSYDRLLFIPVDMPLLSPATVTRLAVDASGSRARCFDGHPLPCLLNIDGNTLRYSEEVLGQMRKRPGSYSVRKFLEPLTPERIRADTALATTLRNTNTPEEWNEVTRESANQ